MDTQIASARNARQNHRLSTRGLLWRNCAERSFLVRHDEQSPTRDRVQQFIVREYRRHFAAEVTEFMPILVGLHGADGSLRAAVGYRSARDGPLFLEAYTKAPIEQMVQLQTGVSVPRNQIVEVGSLACTGGRAAMEIVTALVPALIEDGFSWVVFTGADTVRNVFRRLKLRPVALCIANKAVLGERQHDWGSYYDHNPVVMAGRIADGMMALEAEAVA
jgi:hypothetical protein